MNRVPPGAKIGRGPAVQVRVREERSQSRSAVGAGRKTVGGRYMGERVLPTHPQGPDPLDVWPTVWWAPWQSGHVGSWPSQECGPPCGRLRGSRGMWGHGPAKSVAHRVVGSVAVGACGVMAQPRVWPTVWSAPWQSGHVGSWPSQECGPPCGRLRGSRGMWGSWPSQECGPPCGRLRGSRGMRGSWPSQECGSRPAAMNVAAAEQGVGSSAGPGQQLFGWGSGGGISQSTLLGA